MAGYPQHAEPNWEYDLFVCKTTIAHYCIALDDQEFDMLENVFAEDAVADYTDVRPDIGEVRGREAITDRLKAVLKGKRTQHALTTQMMHYMEKGKCSIRSYFTANTFSEEDGKFKHTTVYGYYDDEMKPDGAGGWHIVRRKLGMHVSEMLVTNIVRN